MCVVIRYELVNGEPRIAALPHETGLIINPQTMEARDEEVLLKRVAEILREMNSTISVTYINIEIVFAKIFKSLVFTLQF